MRRDAGRAVVTVLLLVLATRLGHGGVVDGAAWFWPPAAVATWYLLTARRLDGRHGLAALGVLWLGLSVAALPDVVAGDLPAGRAAAGVVPVALAYLGGGLLVHRARRRWGSSTLGEMSLLLLASGLAAPLVARGGEAVLVALASGGGLDLADVARLALADGRAVVAFVPLVVGLDRGQHAAMARRQIVGCAVAVLAVVAAAAAAADGVLTGPQAAYALVATLLVGATLLGRHGTNLLVAVGGLALWMLAAQHPTDMTALGLEGLFLAAALLAHVMATVLGGAEGSLARTAPVSVARVQVPDQRARVVPTTDDLHERLEQFARAARAAGVLAILFVAAVGGTGGTSTQAWLLVTVPVAGLVGANVYSVMRSMQHDHGLRRRRVETLLDLATITSIYLMLVPGTASDRLPMGLLVVAVAAAVRLPVREAMASTLVVHVAVGLFRLDAHVLPRVGGFDVGDLLGGVIVLALIVQLVGWTIASLVSCRVRADAAAEEAARAHQRLADQQQVLEADRALLQARTDDLARALADRDAAAVELERSREALEAFTAVAAHDLKSPIASAMMLASAAADPTFDEDQRMAFADRVRASLDRSARLVDRLLEHARTLGGQLEVEVLDTSRLVHTVVHDHQAAIEEAGAIVVMPEHLPAVLGDRALLRQAVGNLVANALRYAAVDGHRPTIGVDAVRSGDTLVLTVTDDGPGFADGQVDEHGLVGARTDDEHGVGLGLGLETVRRIASRHGGRVWAHERCDGRRGASVSLSLPLAPVSSATVLVASPDPRTWDVVSSGLGHLGEMVQVRRATAADDTCPDAEASSADVVLVDVARLGGRAQRLLHEARRRGAVVHVLVDDGVPFTTDTAREVRWGTGEVDLAASAMAQWLDGHLVSGLGEAPAAPTRLANLGTPLRRPETVLSAIG